MSKRGQQIAAVVLLGVCLFGFAVWNLVKPDTEESVQERRRLAQAPRLTAEGLLSGSFMKDFESYAVDQFPLRDVFRGIKAAADFSVFRKLDNHGVYEWEGGIGKVEYPLREESVDNAAEKFCFLYEEYLQESRSRIFGVIVPDKNVYLAEESGHLSLDYDALSSCLAEQTEFVEYIEIRDTLSAESYYRTDPHWRQEKLSETAKRIAGAMGMDLREEYRVETLEMPFYGSYYGQLALPVDADIICILNNELLRQCRVYNYETGREGPVYDMEKASGKDPYEVFLSGPVALLELTNPQADTDRELIVFRDSFASSLIPLLAENYAKITLVDIRYLSGRRLGEFLDFHGQDILFLYSTLVLNNSETLK